MPRCGSKLSLQWSSLSFLNPGQVDTSTTATANPPVFTCFGSANEGLPLNPRNAFYYQDKPDSYGFTPNPYGFGYRDLGMGTFLRSGFGSGSNPNRNSDTICTSC
jgi:cytochrome c peroxidase